MRRSVRGTTALLAGSALLMSAAACSTSPESLVRATEDLPGVVSVDASEEEGDDGLPFDSPPIAVEVVMEADATASEILAVYDEYEDELDGDISYVQLRLEGPKQAVLVTDHGVLATSAMADDLVAAAADADVVAYRREALHAVPGVTIQLAPVGLEQATEVVGRYRDADGVNFIQVEAGEFLLIRDEDNGIPGRYDKREAFTLAVDERFGLTGAVVTDRGKLVLHVAPADRQGVERFVRSANLQELGRVAVRASTVTDP